MEPHSTRDPIDSELRAAVASFARPSARQSLLQLATSFGPFLAGCAAMYVACGISAWLVLALAMPSGAFMVRVFIVQHDCGHGSFLASRLAKSAKVRQSIIRHAFRFFVGRNEFLSDSKTLMGAEQAYLQSGGSFDAVIVSLLTSDSFIYRKPATKN